MMCRTSRTMDGFETGQVEVLRFFKDDRGKPVIYGTADSSEEGMFLLFVPCVNHIEGVPAREIDKFPDLGNRVLEVIVHYHDPFAGTIIKSGHDGIVLADVLRQAVKSDDVRVGFSIFACILFPNRRANNR